MPRASTISTCIKRDSFIYGRALSLLFKGRLSSLPESCNFHFADRALYPQYQSVIDGPGVVDRLYITEQSANHTTKLHQCMQIAAIARQARYFAAKHCADFAITKIN